jgi:glycerophosphoryl diester phosphodiesterase
MAKRTLIAAHRGGAILWPENSATAFRECAKLPVDQVECDIHLTADKQLAVIHDATLNRTTDTSGPVYNRTMRKLRSLRLRGAGGEAPPSLDEMLQILAPTQIGPRIEIKCDAQRKPYPGIVDLTLAALDAANMRGRAWVIGFHAETMAQAVAAGGLAGVSWLAEQNVFADLGVNGMIAVAKHFRFPEIGLPENMVDEGVVSALRAAGIGINVWGCNTTTSITRAMEIGVDLLATDDPPLALSLRDAA